MAEGDPYYGPPVVDLKRYTAGLRWDIIRWAALKLEYHYIDQGNLNRSFPGKPDGTAPGRRQRC